MTDIAEQQSGSVHGGGAKGARSSVSPFRQTMGKLVRNRLEQLGS